MLTYPAHVLTEMKRVCEAYGVFFIADEVMTGWGRAGTLFACERANVEPDIMCLAKGLTGGSVPLAVTLCPQKIFEAHRSTDRTKTFFHSSSYTANPIACAAAAANLDVWKREPVAERIAALTRLQTKHRGTLRTDTRFKNVRQLGTIVAFELKAPDAGYLAAIGPKLYAFFLERNVLLRPLGNTIYVMPPYCISEAELDQVYNAIGDAADQVDRWAAS